MTYIWSYDRNLVQVSGSDGFIGMADAYEDAEAIVEQHNSIIHFYSQQLLDWANMLDKGCQPKTVSALLKHAAVISYGKSGD